MSRGRRFTLCVPANVRRAMVSHARRDAPRECCGLLVGRGHVVIGVVAMQNVARGNSRFRFDDREHIFMRRMLRRFQPPLEILGMYHSHPVGPSTPSVTDLAESHYPDWAYLIVNLASARTSIRGFLIVGGTATDLQLQS